MSGIIVEIIVGIRCALQLMSRPLLFQSSFHGRHLLLEVIQMIDTVLHHVVLIADVLEDERHLLQILVAVIGYHVHLRKVLQRLMHNLCNINWFNL